MNTHRRNDPANRVISLLPLLRVLRRQLRLDAELAMIGQLAFRQASSPDLTADPVMAETGFQRSASGMRRPSFRW